ncbi:uncharacterized protein [Nicotiana tomentosiformis]|uniref:uncharacterized protein n=1 Tax=Nicotiana tomentosiformis TaxID=4098 RepID=UPI00388C343C
MYLFGWDSGKKSKRKPTGPATVVLNDEETKDEVVALQRRKRSSSAQSGAQQGELQTPPPEEVQGLQGKWIWPTFLPPSPAKVDSDKQKLASERDQLLTERNKLVERFSILEAKVTQIDDLEARLQQYKQDRMDHSQETAQLHENFKEAKAKYVELHDIVTVAAERESAFMEQINNLKAKLHSKTKKANDYEERRAKMEERLKNVMEQNRLHSTTNVELDSKISTMKAENEKLQSQIDKLRAKLQNPEDSLIFKKTYIIYHTKRKTFAEAKKGIININDCIAKA